MLKTLKPLTLTWLQLFRVMQPLHLGYGPDIDALHDIWKVGAPIPQSRILNPKGYDERKRQLGNFEARIIFPNLLAKWIMDVSARRGFPYTWEQAIALQQGEVIY